jgi:hypothetical protein
MSSIEPTVVTDYDSGMLVAVQSRYLCLVLSEADFIDEAGQSREGRPTSGFDSCIPK